MCRKLIEETVRIESSTAQKKPTLHQVPIMLATSKNVLFPGHNHLLTTSTVIKVKGHQYRWLAGGYDLEIGHF